MKEEYKQIAAYEAEDYRAAMDRVTAEPSFRLFLDGICQRFGAEGLTPDAIIGKLQQTASTEDLDREIIFPGLWWIAAHRADSFVLDGAENVHGPALFITNHRDIIMDAAFLSILLERSHGILPYMAIGTNLYVQPWVEDFMRLNRTFSVIRGGAPREVMTNSQRLSAYMRYVMSEAGGSHSIWIAQREGRAKDGDDRTQPALLKMLAMTGNGSPAERLAALNLTPAALCYEYDPCDYLKAREMQLRRDNPQWHKTSDDDYQSMLTGIMGRKGRIVFRITPSLSEELLQLAARTDNRNEQITAAARLTDRHIHRHDHIVPSNRIALDLMESSSQGGYTEEEKQTFLNYLQGQLDTTELPSKDEHFLRERLLEMYANPLRNQLKAQENA